MQPQNQNEPLQPPAPAQPVQPPVPPAPVAPAAPAPQPAAPPVQQQQPVAPPPQPAPVEQPVDVADQEEFIDDEEYVDEAGDGAETDAGEEVDLTEPVNWQAKEYVHEEKNGLWFVSFGVIFFVLMVIAVLFMKSWTFAALLVVIAVVLLILARRPPRIMSYSLSDKGLHIGDTLHAFSDFRAFGIIHDGQEYSVMLIPTKRFLPGITVYFPEESGEKIVDALGSRLPMQDLKLDIVDQIVRKLRLG